MAFKEIYKGFKYTRLNFQEIMNKHKTQEMYQSNGLEVLHSVLLWQVHVSFYFFLFILEKQGAILQIF